MLCPVHTDSLSAFGQLPAGLATYISIHSPSFSFVVLSLGSLGITSSDTELLTVRNIPPITF
jgi:hypothetical protein